jgi:hypothetical protein
MAVILAWIVTCADGGITFDNTGFCAAAGGDKANGETPTVIIMAATTSEVDTDFDIHPSRVLRPAKRTDFNMVAALRIQADR